MILGQTLDINGNIIQKAKFEPLATDPSAGSYIGSLSGAIYFNTTSGVNRIHNGTEWVNIAKIQGTGNNITVTYSGNPLVATLTLASGIDATKIADGSVTSTEFQYINTLSANAQTQLTTLSASRLFATNGADNRIATFSNSNTLNGESNLTFDGSLLTVSAIDPRLVLDGPPGSAKGVRLLDSGTQRWFFGSNTTNQFMINDVSAGDYPIIITSGSSGTVTLGAPSRKINIPNLSTSAVVVTDGSKNLVSSNITTTELGYLDNVTSNIQDQLNSKATTASLSDYQTRSEKGVANGYASLDSNGKVPTSQLPEEILGNMVYKGTWNASTNSPSITTATSANKGWYYIVTVSGTTIPSGLNPNTSASIMSGSNQWNIGDWIVSDGTYLDKIDNTDQVMSVFGRMGAVIAAAGDYNASQITNTAAGGITATDVQNALNELDTEKVPKTTTITAGTGLTGGGDLSTNRTISLATTGTAGTYTKVTTNAYGQVTAGTTLTSADVPTLPTTKILETATDRFVSDSQISSWDSSVSYIGTVSAEVANINVRFREDFAYGYSKLASFSNTSNGQTVGILVDAFGYVVADDRRGTFRVFFGANQNVAMTSPAATPVLRVEGNESNSWTFGYTIDTDTSATKTYSLWCHHPANYAYLAGSVRYQGRPVTVYENQVPTSAVPSGYVAGSYSDKKLNSLLLDSLSTSAVVVTDGSKNLVSSPITTTELGHLDGTSANIQNQLSNLSASKQNTLTNPVTGTGSASRLALWNSNSEMTSNEGFLFGTTSGIGRYIIVGSPNLSGSAALYLKNAAGYDSNFICQDPNGANRWLFGKAASTDNFFINNATSAGNFIDTPFSITDGSAGAIILGGAQNNRSVRITSLSTSAVVVTDESKNLVSSPITTTELGYLDNATSNIQDQLNNITNGTSTRYSTTINIASGVQSFTITHNLGYLRPNVTVIDEVSDREIMVTPIYTSTSQLSLPITSSQAFTGAIVEVYI